MNHFKYKRVEKVVKIDSNNNPVAILDDKGVPVPGQFEMEQKVYYDTLNVDYIIRTVRIDDNRLLVLLDDGHEVSERVPKIKNPKKGPVVGNVIEERQRVWMQSEIMILEEDIDRLFKVLDV